MRALPLIRHDEIASVGEAGDRAGQLGEPSDTLLGIPPDLLGPGRVRLLLALPLRALPFGFGCGQVGERDLTAFSSLPELFDLPLVVVPHRLLVLLLVRRHGVSPPCRCRSCPGRVRRQSRA